MKDFGQWFNDFKPVAIEPELPAGVIEMKPDSGYPRYMVFCCVCDNLVELPVGIDEIDDDYEHYCGGSPRCCP
jgi:hypothetical protein